MNLIRRLLALAPALQPVAILATRLALGHSFLRTGLGKLQNLERTTQFFASIGIPLPSANALLVGVLELVGGTCLMLGLGTRVFSALLAGTLAVALLTADRGAFLGAFQAGSQTGFLDVAAFTFLLFLVWLLASGSGPLSADRLLLRRFGTPRAEAR